MASQRSVDASRQHCRVPDPQSIAAANQAGMTGDLRSLL